MFKFILPRFIFRMERWKWNKEYRIYVSNMGHFMDKHKRVIPIRVNQSGYVGIKTPYGFILAHRLVMRTWRPTVNMEGLTVDHLDHNKRNNSVENLEWVTSEENFRRACEDYIDQNEKPTQAVFKAEDFYPVINGFVFDDIQAVWQYVQKILTGPPRVSCTLEGIQKRLQILLNCWNANNTDYIINGKTAKYCGLEIGITLKRNKE